MSFLKMQMPLTQALMVALIGLITVIIVLAFIAVCIIVISKIIRAIEAAAAKKSEAVPSASSAPSAPSAVPMPEGMNQGELELVGTDEKTAAVIMAIVSQKSGIPLNRLSFKSIRLKEDEKQ